MTRKQRYGKPGPDKVADTAKPEIRYFVRQPNGLIEVRTKPWVRPVSREAINEWIGEYLDRVREGYVPAGLDFAPIPFAARITLAGRVVAEWSAPKSRDNQSVVYVSAKPPKCGDANKGT